MQIDTSLTPKLTQKKKIALSIGTLGIVFGDIGTSPLYAINEIFFGSAHPILSPATILGCISLVFWTLTLVICVKYLSFVVLADNEGEGGVFALYARIHKFKNGPISILKTLLMLSAGLLIGGGVITPAISVLSAVEGINILSPNFESWTIPIAVTILFCLFAIQKFGTHLVGRFFSPIALIWFSSIGILGALNIYEQPTILWALNPVYAFDFLLMASLKQTLLILGSVMLVVTGGESIFADMGHFRLGSIRTGWFTFVYPALILNYLGQGAFLIGEKQIINQNIFYSMIPSALIIPMVILATFAAIIASQALISGAFSAGSQAIALGLFPRLSKVHTHHDHAGHVYIPFINWALFLGTITLVFLFKTSKNLAAAYGLSSSGVMLLTSFALIAIAIEYWKWSPWKSFTVFGFFVLIDSMFLTANSLKFLEGGYVPLIIGLMIFTIMRIWRWGRKATYAAYSDFSTPTLQELVDQKSNSTESIPRNVVLMVPKPLRSLEENTPALVQFFINRYGLLPKNLFLVEVVHRKTPLMHEPRCEQYTFYEDESKGIIQSVTIHFGFMEEPNVELILERLVKMNEIHLPKDPHQWLVHVAHERLIPGKHWNWFEHLRLKLFLFLRQSTQPAYYYYGLGTDVNLSLEIMPVRLK